MEIFSWTKDRIYVKGYVFLSFARNMGTHLSNKYSQKLLDSANKDATIDAIKTTSKRAMQKTAEATGDLIRNKIDNKITNISKKSSRELHSRKLQNNKANDGIEISKERYISPGKRQKNIDELRLV